jgi:hypothetical protein
MGAGATLIRLPVQYPSDALRKRDTTADYSPWACQIASRGSCEDHVKNRRKPTSILRKTRIPFFYANFVHLRRDVGRTSAPENPTRFVHAHCTSDPSPPRRPCRVCCRSSRRRMSSASATASQLCGRTEVVTFRPNLMQRRSESGRR